MLEAKYWDWTLNNAELGRQQSLSRERIRQIRRDLGISAPPIRGPKERTAIKIIRKIKQEEKEIKVNSIKKIQENVSCPYLRLVLNKHGIKYLHGNQKYPWGKINWNLPNTIIQEIWNIPYHDIVEFRNKTLQGDALWDKVSMNQVFLRQIDQEKIKVIDYGCRNN